MKKSDSLIFTLSKKAIKWLFVFYSAIILIGGFVAIYIAYLLTDELTQAKLIVFTFISSIATGEMLCAVQYIKRLYKACITNRIVPVDDSLKYLGNISYFLLRPLFAFAFVIVIVFFILSGVYIITGNLDYILNEKFLYLCVIISSFVGYSTGKFLDKFEEISEDKISTII